MAQKKALIAVNYSGFMCFMNSDKDILQQMGYEVYVAGDYSLDIENGTFERENPHTIHIPIASKSPLNKTNIRGFLSYTKLIKKNDFDLIICHTPITGLLVRLAAFFQKKKNTKVIYWTHGLSWTKLTPFLQKKKFQFFEALGSFLCDVIITINKEDYNEAKKLFCKQVFHVNGVGLDITKYSKCQRNRETVRKDLNIPERKIFILSVGELSFRKNHQIIVKAVGNLPNKDQYVYGICGRVKTDFANVKYLKSLAESLDVDLRLLGFRDDIPDIMHACDFGAIPSLREGLGMAGLQQLCAGKPIIGTDVQGIREYCIDGMTGFLIKDPQDVDAFSIAIERLSNKDLCDSMKLNCLEIVSQFDLEKSCLCRRDIYTQVLRDNQ